MNLPTKEEIHAAHELVDVEGPQSETTIGLAKMALTDAHLAAFVDNVTKSTAQLTGITMAEHLMILRSSLLAALIGGLNLGIRIGEAREPVTEDEPLV